MSEANLRENFRRRFKKLFPGVMRVAYPQSGAGYKGFPDEFYIVNGRFVSLEWKRPGENPTPTQVAAMRSIRRAGGVVAVVHNSAEAAQVLRSILES